MLKSGGKKSSTPGASTGKAKKANKKQQPAVVPGSATEGSGVLGDLIDAPLTASGNVPPLPGELELQRGLVQWAGTPSGGRAHVTLTNRRLLFRAVTGRVPQQLDVSAVRKVTSGSSKGGGGFLGLGGKKKANGASLTLKLTDDAKHEMVFQQPPASLRTAAQERDDFVSKLKGLGVSGNPH